MSSKKTVRAIVAVATLAVVTAGCSTKAEDSGGGSGGGSSDVATDVGIEGTTITLGALTDLTGVFAALGNDITNGNSLFWEENKVCDTYDVEIDVQDTSYNVQTAVQLYSGMKDNVLGMQQTIGSSINTALGADYQADQVINFPSAWGKTLTEIPGTGVLGATYDIEIANGYDYLLQEGLLAEGDTVGHIYFEGEYGENALAGSEAAAEAYGLELAKVQIKATDSDMTAQVTQLAAAGADVIVLTVAPPQLASVAAVVQAQGLDVPILGSNPVFAPGLLEGPTADILKKNLYIASPISAFDEHPEILEAYQAAFPEITPSLGVVFGYGMAETMKQVLDSACEEGDLTREGVLAAFEGLSDVDTGGLIVPLRGFESGKSPSLESYILKPDDVPGGASLLQDAFTGDLASTLDGE
ncbi:MAG: ABC transporter substrate-binding protein [Nocardioides sp.]|nr:ABC transporter substrate-binding protein [Nocardioides sp.]